MEKLNEACHLLEGGSRQKHRANGFLRPVLHASGIQIYRTTWCRNPEPRVPIKMANVWGLRETRKTELQGTSM